jgi:hypothetical protein
MIHFSILQKPSLRPSAPERAEQKPLAALHIAAIVSKIS